MSDLDLAFASLTILGIGVAGLAGYGWRRRTA